MKGVEFADQNCIFTKPEGMAQNQCESLPAKRTTVGGFPCVESVFELTDDELEQIIKSKRVRLGVIGNTMPPVRLTVEAGIDPNNIN